MSKLVDRLIDLMIIVVLLAVIALVSTWAIELGYDTYKYVTDDECTEEQIQQQRRG